MKPVYQQINSPVNGDCLQCAVASLFELKYETVPSFILSEMGEYDALAMFLWKMGWRYEGVFVNPNVWSEPQYSEHTLDKISKIPDIHGLYLATVASPRHHRVDLPIREQKVLHAVLVNSKCEIVFDPNLRYLGLEKYPFSEQVGFNGVLTIDVIVK